MRSAADVDLFQSRLADDAAATEATLAALLADAAVAGEIVRPPRLVAAMRHAVLGGGKRLRPFLMIETARLFGVENAGVLRAAAGLELLHCYSLVHDDLPAMDDDDLRRGRPTVHKAFDEATAILAGDGLLTLAFAHLGEHGATDPAIRARLVVELAAGAGSGGMVGGQMRDIEGETVPLDLPGIARMQAMKTGALIRAAVRMGAILGGADPATLGYLTAYAEAAGRAFQLADDILDVTASAAPTQSVPRSMNSRYATSSTTATHTGPGNALINISRFNCERTRATRVSTACRRRSSPAAMARFPREKCNSQEGQTLPLKW